MAQSQLFRPGQPVEQSGLYRVFHHEQHASVRDLIFLQGYEFPPCSVCGDNVVFELFHPCRYFAEDYFFKPQKT